MVALEQQMRMYYSSTTCLTAKNLQFYLGQILFLFRDIQPGNSTRNRLVEQLLLAATFPYRGLMLLGSDPPTPWGDADWKTIPRVSAIDLWDLLLARYWV